MFCLLRINQVMSVASYERSFKLCNMRSKDWSILKNHSRMLNFRTFLLNVPLFFYHKDENDKIFYLKCSLFTSLHINDFLSFTWNFYLMNLQLLATVIRINKISDNLKENNTTQASIIVFNGNTSPSLNTKLNRRASYWPISEVKSSGAELPAAMKVAPATSWLRWRFWWTEVKS